MNETRALFVGINWLVGTTLVVLLALLWFL